MVVMVIKDVHKKTKQKKRIVRKVLKDKKTKEK